MQFRNEFMECVLISTVNKMRYVPFFYLSSLGSSLPIRVTLSHKEASFPGKFDAIEIRLSLLNWKGFTFEVHSDL